ncbi:MAG TPA: hypothetical protein PLP17_02185 [Oligoflexia bacterium]|nr:hypothetical protein [Oligoflexia bacterium]
MGILAALAPALAPAANSVMQSSGSAPRESDAGKAHSSNAGVVVSSQAAVVTLSMESKGRAASAGPDGRRVDAGFEKQDATGKSAAEHEEQKEKVKGKLDVAA